MIMLLGIHDLIDPKYREYKNGELKLEGVEIEHLRTQCREAMPYAQATLFFIGARFKILSSRTQGPGEILPMEVLKGLLIVEELTKR